MTDTYFRNNVLCFVTSQHTLSFWKNEFDKYPPALKNDAITPILNKTGVFLTSSILRNIVGQRNTSFDMQKIIDEGKILIVNLAKGEIGEDAASILGSMIVTQIQLAALNRSKIPEDQRKPFYLFVDEMHSFVSLSFADILSEARKYKLALFMAHQYIEQLHEKIRFAIFGNVGTMISFRIGAEDAEHVAKEFKPILNEEDFVTLPKYSMYIKLMIDGTTSLPFSATTIPPKEPFASNKEEVIKISRQMNARSKDIIEKEIFEKKSSSKASKSSPSLF